MVIPDLDDEDEIYPLPNLDSKSGSGSGEGSSNSSSGIIHNNPTLSSSTSSPPRPSRGPFRGAELNFHNRAGSATGSGTSEEWENNLLSNSGSGFATTNSNSSSNQSQFVNLSSSNYNESNNLNSSTNTPTPSTSYRFPPSNTNPTPSSASSFSFPRKASFASLKAAIKGQSSNTATNNEASHNVGSSGAYGFGGGSFNGASVVSSALGAFPPGMGVNNSSGGSYFPNQSGPDSGSMSSRRGGGGGGIPISSSSISGPFSGNNKFNPNSHGRQASYFSEQSTGAASSSADSQGQSQSQNGAPPLPPFPEAFGQNVNPFQQQHGRQYSNSSSAANASSFIPPSFIGGNHPGYNMDLKQMKSRASNERERDGDQALGSPFLGGGSGFSYPSSSSRGGYGGAMMTSGGSSSRFKPPQPRQDSFDTNSLDLVPVQSLEASSISDPISPSSYRDAAGLAANAPRSIHDGTGTRTPTVPGGFHRNASNHTQQFGMESQGLGTLPRGIGTIDPSTPAEYAMNILMSRFITLAGLKIQTIMERNVVSI